MHKKIALSVLLGALPTALFAAIALPQQEKAALHRTVVVTQEHLNTIIQDMVSALLKVDEIRQNAPAINSDDVVVVVESLVDTVKPLITALNNVIDELQIIIQQKNSLSPAAKKEYSRILKGCVDKIDVNALQQNPQKAIFDIVNTLRATLAQAERSLKN